MARIARKRKRDGMPFPTFCRAVPHIYGPLGIQPAARGGMFRDRRAAGSADLFPQAHFRTGLFLQLALERLDLFGERDILGHQRFDLAHGMQHRGVVASAEPPADLGQRAQG